MSFSQHFILLKAPFSSTLCKPPLSLLVRSGQEIDKRKRKRNIAIIVMKWSNKARCRHFLALDLRAGPAVQPPAAAERKDCIVAAVALVANLDSLRAGQGSPECVHGKYSALRLGKAPPLGK